MAALPLHREQPAVDEFRKVTAGCLRGDVCDQRELPGGHRFAVHQGRQHRRSRRVAE
jgi:hypothetical protein